MFVTAIRQRTDAQSYAQSKPFEILNLSVVHNRLHMRVGFSTSASQLFHSSSHHMQRLHKPSGYYIDTAVFFYEDISKFSPGVIITNSIGMKTSRMAVDPTMYDLEEEAEAASFEVGKQLLSKHLSGKEELHFHQQ